VSGCEPKHSPVGPQLLAIGPLSGFVAYWHRGYYSRSHKLETKQRRVVVCLFASKAPGRRPTPAQNWHKTTLDPEVLERTVAPKAVISEIEEPNKPVLPIEMPCLAGLDGTQDRVIFFLNVCFSSLPEGLRPDLGFRHRECVYYR
jgi:hypothetical protein